MRHECYALNKNSSTFRGHSHNLHTDCRLTVDRKITTFSHTQDAKQLSFPFFDVCVQALFNHINSYYLNLYIREIHRNHSCSIQELNKGESRWKATICSPKQIFFTFFCIINCCFARGPLFHLHLPYICSLILHPINFPVITHNLNEMGSFHIFFWQKLVIIH